MFLLCSNVSIFFIIIVISGSVNVAKAAVKMAVQSKNFISIIATEGQLQAAKNALTAAELAQAIQSIK